MELTNPPPPIKGVAIIGGQASVKIQEMALVVKFKG